MTEKNGFPVTSFIAVDDNILKKVIINENGESSTVFYQINEQDQKNPQLNEVKFENGQYIPLPNSNPNNKPEHTILDINGIQSAGLINKKPINYLKTYITDNGLEKNRNKKSYLIKVDENTYISLATAEDENQQKHNYINCYKQNGDSWQNVSNADEYQNVLIYNDGFTCAGEPKSKDDVKTRQIYVPSVEFDDVFANKYNTNVLKNKEKKQGCSFSIGIDTTEQASLNPKKREYTEAEQEALLNATTAPKLKTNEDVTLDQTPLAIIPANPGSKEDLQNTRFNVNNRTDMERVTSIMQQHNVDDVLAYIQQEEPSKPFVSSTASSIEDVKKQRVELHKESEQLEVQVREYEESQQVLQQKIEEESKASLTDIAYHEYAQDLIRQQCINNPKVLGNLEQRQKEYAEHPNDLPKLSTKEELQTIFPDIEDAELSKNMVYIFDRILQGTIQGKPYEAFHDDLIKDQQERNKYNSNKTKIEENKTKLHEIGIQPKQAVMYFNNPNQDLENSTETICSMQVNTGAESNKMFHDIRNEYDLNKIADAEFSTIPLQNNSNLIVPSHFRRSNISNGQICSILKADDGTQNNLDLQKGGAILHFDNDTIVNFQPGNDSQAPDIQIFPNTVLQDEINSDLQEKAKLEWRDGDYIDIILTQNSPSLVLRNVNDNSRLIDLSNRAKNIMPLLQPYKLDEVYQSVSNYTRNAKKENQQDIDEDFPNREYLTGKNNIFTEESQQQYIPSQHDNYGINDPSRRNRVPQNTKISYDALYDPKHCISGDKIVSLYTQDVKDYVNSLRGIVNTTLPPDDLTGQNLKEKNKEFYDIKHGLQLADHNISLKLDDIKALETILIQLNQDKIDGKKREALTSKLTEIKFKGQKPKKREIKAFKDALKTNDGFTKACLNLQKDKLDAIDKDIKSANTLINNFRTFSLPEPPSVSQSPARIGQQYSRYMEYEHNMQRIQARNEQQLNDHLIELSTSAEQATNARKELNDLNKKVIRESKTIDNQMAWMDKTVSGISDIPNLSVKDKQKYIVQAFVCSHTATLLDILNQEAQGKELSESQKNIKELSQVYGEVVDSNKKVDTKKLNQFIDRFDLNPDTHSDKTEGEPTLQTLTDRVANCQTQYDRMIAEGRVPTTFKKITPPPEPIIADDQKLRTTFAIDPKTGLITKQDLDTGTQVLLKSFACNDLQGQPSWIICEVEEVKKDGQTYYKPKLEGIKIEDNDDLRAGKLSDAIATQLRTDMSNDNLFFPDKVNPFLTKLDSRDKTKPCIYSTDSPDECIEIDTTSNTLQCFKNNGTNWQNVSNQLSCTDIALYNDGSVISTNFSAPIPENTKPELNCQVYLSAPDPIEGEKQQPGTCIYTRSDSTNKKNDLFLVSPGASAKEPDVLSPLDNNDNIRQQMQQHDIVDLYHASVQTKYDTLNKKFAQDLEKMKNNHGEWYEAYEARTIEDLDENERKEVQDEYPEFYNEYMQIGKEYVQKNELLNGIIDNINKPKAELEPSGTIYYINPEKAECIYSCSVLRDKNTSEAQYDTPHQNKEITVGLKDHTVETHSADPNMFINDISNADNNMPLYAVQLRNSDGTFTPPLPFKPMDGIVKFGDDTVAILQAPEEKEDPGIIRIIPGKELVDVLNKFLPLAKDGESSKFPNGLEEGDFIEIQIGDPSYIMIKNLKDPHCMDPNNTETIQRRIDIGSLAKETLQALNKNYNLQSLAELFYDGNPVKEHLTVEKKPLSSSEPSIQSFPKDEENPLKEKNDQSLTTTYLNTNLQDLKPNGYTIDLASQEPLTIQDLIKFQWDNGPSQAISSCFSMLSEEYGQIQDLNTPEIKARKKEIDDAAANIYSNFNTFEELDRTIEDQLIDESLEYEKFVPQAESVLLTLAKSAPQNENSTYILDKLDKDELKLLGLPEDYYKKTSEEQQTDRKSAIDQLLNSRKSLNMGIQENMSSQERDEKRQENFQKLYNEQVNLHNVKLGASSIGIDPKDLFTKLADQKEQENLTQQINNGLLQLKNQKTAEINAKVADQTSAILTKHNPLLLPHEQGQKSDPIITAQRYNNFVNAYVGLQNIAQTKGLELPKKEGETLDLQTAQGAMQSLQDAADKGKNWLIANAMRASQSEKLDDKYLEDCGRNVQMSLLATKLLLTPGKDENSKLSDFADTLQNDPIAQTCGIMDKDKKLKEDIADMTLKEFQDFLDQKKVELAQKSIVGCQKKQIIEIDSSILTKADEFNKFYGDEVKAKQTPNAYDLTVLQPKDTLQRGIEETARQIGSIMEKYENDNNNKKIEELQSELNPLLEKMRELEKQKMYLNRANRLLTERKAYIDSNLKQKQEDLDKSVNDNKLPSVNLEDACAAIAQPPAGNRAYINVTFEPKPREENGEKFLVCKINDIGGKSPFSNNDTLKETLEENTKKGVHYEMHMGVGDDKMEEFFLTSREKGLEAAVTSCKLDPKKFSISAIDDKGKTTTMTLEDYQNVCKQLTKDEKGNLQFPANTDKTLFGLMVQANKENVPDLEKNKAKGKTGMTMNY